jgi:hypothetical protein
MRRPPNRRAGPRGPAPENIGLNSDQPKASRTGRQDLAALARKRVARYFEECDLARSTREWKWAKRHLQPPAGLSQEDRQRWANLIELELRP